MPLGADSTNVNPARDPGTCMYCENLEVGPKAAGAAAVDEPPAGNATCCGSKWIQDVAMENK